MTINIKASNIDMTDALKQYAFDKADSLKKYFKNIQKIDVDFGMDSHHHQKGKIFQAQMNVFVPGKILSVSKKAEDLYKAIDKVKDHLKVELDELKGKMHQKDRKHIRESKGYQE
ncbi:ribosome-associated translation inhibitor RaiA [Patescibacteria group bacterium]|nr:ribosome-associated translation inhibitor RaiA [Patescibacteria group bacterium]MBU1721776.1 ribosome-associated translation inhibitor RaiA [Patescibacteria group bacterium]MBU1901385.1 ribosome-associated translation inhibitor RaiA [Patescibacteria group bacterium]